MGPPAVVFHIDAGWNLPVAEENIKKVTDKLGVKLHIEKMDWNEMREMQLAWFKTALKILILLRIMHKYGIPLDKKVFIFGGNLGKPQGISFMIQCLETVKDTAEAFFLIVGDGTEYGKIKAFLSETKQKNVKLMKRLPREDYDTMVGACDVGLLFLDHRFTIPNYPSRLISYMQAKIPVLATTDPNTDIGKNIVDGGFGW